MASLEHEALNSLVTAIEKSKKAEESSVLPTNQIKEITQELIKIRETLKTSYDKHTEDLANNKTSISRFIEVPENKKIIQECFEKIDKIYKILKPDSSISPNAPTSITKEMHQKEHEVSNHDKILQPLMMEIEKVKNNICNLTLPPSTIKNQQQPNLTSSTSHLDLINQPKLPNTSHQR